MGESVNVSDTTAGLDTYGSDAELAAVALFKDYPDGLVNFAFVCCIIYSSIGIPGNLITIVALARCKKVRNATAIFIISLSLSDLLFCCFNLPLSASTFWHRSWVHGKTLCRMFPWAKYGLVAVSLLNVMAITINRYIMVSHPTIYQKIYTTRNIIIMIVSIWISSLSVLIPPCLEVWGRFSLNTVIGSCTIVKDDNDQSPKEALFIIGFLIPSIVIILCYFRILWIVKKSSKKSRGPKPAKSQTELQTLNVGALNTRTRVSDNVRKSTQPQKCFVNAELSSNEDSSLDDDGQSELRPGRLTSDLSPRIQRRFTSQFTRKIALEPRLPTKRDKRLLTMILAIVVSFCVCHLPITLTKTVYKDFTSHPYANIIGYVLMYITTCSNPIIYVVLSSEYRQAYKSLFKCSQ